MWGHYAICRDMVGSLWGQRCGRVREGTQQAPWGDIVVWGDTANSMRGHSRVPVGVSPWGHYSVWEHYTICGDMVGPLWGHYKYRKGIQQGPCRGVRVGTLQFVGMWWGPCVDGDVAGTMRGHSRSLWGCDSLGT